MVAVATLPGMPGPAVARRAAEARERVPVRVPLPDGRWPRWQELTRVSPPDSAQGVVRLAG